MYFPLFLGVLCLSLFCDALHFVHSSFAIILKRKRKLVTVLLLYYCLTIYRCIVTVNILLLFLMVPWVDLQCVIVVSPDHTHLLFNILRFDSQKCIILEILEHSLMLFFIQEPS